MAEAYQIAMGHCSWCAPRAERVADAVMMTFTNVVGKYFCGDLLDVAYLAIL